MGTEYLAVAFTILFAIATSLLLGRYMFRVFTGQRTWLDPVLGPIERLVLRVTGVDPDEQQDWKRHPGGVADDGADDYLTKPFGLGELLARMRVALRHAARAAGEPEDPVVVVGDLRVDLARREVAMAGRAVHLTPIEWKLLVLLARNAGKVVTHRQILREVWGSASGHETHTVRVHMAALRRKIEADPARPRLLLTEPSVGYRLREG
jgi:hypothetical protein